MGYFYQDFLNIQHFCICGYAIKPQLAIGNTKLKQGKQVIGVDEFNDYYNPELKRQNIANFQNHPAFELVEGDIQVLDWHTLLEDVDVVYHQTAQAGVRASWGQGFRSYTERNINTTQVLLLNFPRSFVLKILRKSCVAWFLSIITQIFVPM